MESDYQGDGVVWFQHGGAGCVLFVHNRLLRSSGDRFRRRAFDFQCESDVSVVDAIVFRFEL